ncbi:hypothetical protein LCGC14_2200150, partial [marine sediment metagenome]
MVTHWTIAAVSAAGTLAQLGQIFYHIVLPIGLLAGLGFVLQRKLGLDMPTLTRLNFYLIIPGLIYYAVVTSTLTGGRVFTVILFGVCMLAALAAVTYLVAILRGVPRDYRRAMLMTTIFYNSGNYGLPLQDLAFRSTGMGNAAQSVQVFVVIVQNLGNFTLGVLLAAGGGGREKLKRNLLHIAKFPPIYALAAALLTVQIGKWLGDDAAGAATRALAPFWQVIKYVRGAFIAVALCTLGAQLGLLRRSPNRYPVTVSVVLRLLVGPALGLAMVYAFGLTGFLAQVLLISTATPTAVNCMLLCLEFDNHPDYAARAVFYNGEIGKKGQGMRGATVVNMRYESYDVMGDRSSFAGNPFVLGRDGSRAEV